MSTQTLKAQAFLSEFAPRLRGNFNSLLTPVPPTVITQSGPRLTKRGTAIISYAEALDEDEFEDSDTPRRHTGLRTRKENPQEQSRQALVQKLSKEPTAPIETQGIWREWFAKPPFGKSDKQINAQALLPLTLIPIRIDLNINPFQPQRALPPPPSADGQPNMASLMPQFKAGDMTTSFKLKDFFLWNLHEALITPKQFATILVHELDLAPHQGLVYIEDITNQIRTQLEEYAGVALHPLFHASSSIQKKRNGSLTGAPTAAATPAGESYTPKPAASPIPGGLENLKPGTSVVPVGVENDSISATAAGTSEGLDVNNPDDMYRCIVTLSINLLNKLYTDKFEWSLLHPPGIAEQFAKLTCADLGLAGEWVPAMAHAIYEAVLKLKKEACENGGLVGGGFGDIDNAAANGREAGWRYDPDGLGDEWEPKIEILSKDEIERREGDRERQIRRLRRETARFSSTTNMGVGTGLASLFDQQEAEALGRGARARQKKRLRSLSPSGRNTPGNSEVTGYGGGAGVLSERDRGSWRCAHCLIRGHAVWSVREGPAGPDAVPYLRPALRERQEAAAVDEETTRQKRLEFESHGLFDSARAGQLAWKHFGKEA